MLTFAEMLQQEIDRLRALSMVSENEREWDNLYGTGIEKICEARFNEYIYIWYSIPEKFRYWYDNRASTIIVYRSDDYNASNDIDACVLAHHLRKRLCT